jgi:5-methylcytosine-specific restriction protein A
LPPLEQADLQETGEAEGAFSYSIVKQYERSRMNRAACIEIHGTDCSICGFNFGARFGKDGEGLIHIHHVVPVSLMNGSYRLDPGKDLIPVCPNCHAMLHRKNPPYFPEELRQLLRKE